MVEWITSENPVGYEEAVRWMEARVADILRAAPLRRFGFWSTLLFTRLAPAPMPRISQIRIALTCFKRSGAGNIPIMGPARG